jgi:hypothetical protein
VPVGLGVQAVCLRSASDTALPPRRRYALKVTLSCATVGKDVSSPPPRQCAQRVPGRVEWQGGRGCLHLGAWRDGPLTDNPPEGYTRVRAPSAPDERLSRTRGSPVGRLAGLPGMRAVRPIPSGAGPGTVVLSPRACPVSSPLGPVPGPSWRASAYTPSGARGLGVWPCGPVRQTWLRVPPGEVVPIGAPLAAESAGGRVHGGPGPQPVSGPVPSECQPFPETTWGRT